MPDLPARITLSRAKGWRLQDLAPGAVIVSRPSMWGNPWIVGDPGRIIIGARGDDSAPFCEYDLRNGFGYEFALSRDQAAKVYHKWLATGVSPEWALPRGLTEWGDKLVKQWLTKRRATIIAALPTLRGKPLACWCKPGCPCHADVLLRLANA